MYELDLVCFEVPFRFDYETMRRVVEDPAAIVIVAESGGELAGFIVVHPVRRKGGIAGYVVTLDVAPRFRRLGLALELLAETESEAAEAGADGIALHVFVGNAGAIAFYERAGYLRGPRKAGFYGQGLDAWTYWRALSQEAV